MPDISDAEKFINEKGTTASHLEAATEMVAREVGDAYVPASILDNVILQLAQELKTRQMSPGGFTSFGGDEVTGRLARDPMTSIRPILRPWLIPFS